jgi:hypothetical protein
MAVLAVCYGVALAVVFLGHVLALVFGAVDAVVTAWLGVPRLAVTLPRVGEQVRRSWRQQQAGGVE